MSNKLVIDSVALQLGQRQLLKDIFLQLRTGEVTGLLGRNGEGKSCLLEIIYGTKRAQYSIIRFNDLKINCPYLENELVTFLPQFNFVPKSLTLARVFSDFNLAFTDFEMWLPELKQNPNIKMSQLSGGYQRMVEIYIIIKSQSLFAILDEPFNALMPLHVTKVIDLIEQERHRKGFLITDHNYQKVFEISTNCHILSNGKTNLIHSIDDLISYGYINAK